MTYLEFSAKEVTEARDAAARGDDLGSTGGQSSELSRMLRGGALDVKVHPVWLRPVDTAVPPQPSLSHLLTCASSLVTRNPAATLIPMEVAE